MNTIQLKRLTLRDFQGGTFTVDADGESINIYGANGSGKTRLMSAMLWLLTGKDSLGRSDFEIKNLDKSGNQEHGLEHTVEAIFCVGDNNELVLKKVYHEVWTKKRGSAKAEMTGNTTDHFIDGVPVKENEYRTRVSDIFGDEVRFRILTNPAAFALMPWQKQRSLLLDVCGHISDDEIITYDDHTHGVLGPLRAALAKYTASKTPLDDLKKVTMGRRTEINKQIDQIPVRIDEARRGLPDVTGLDKTSLSAEIAALDGELNAAKLRLAGVDTGGRIAPLTKELAGVSSEISKMENEHFLKQTADVTKLDQRIRELNDVGEAAARKAKSIKADIEEKRRHVADLDKTIEALRENWSGVDGEEFQDGTQTSCPACGQNLPEGKVEESREKAKANFNASKAERLTEIQRRGKHLKAERDRIAGEIDQLSSHVPAEYTDHQNPEIECLTIERNAIKDTAENYSLIIGRQDLLDRKAVLEKSIADAKGSIAEDRQAIIDEIADIEPRLAEVKEKFGRFANLAYSEGRIKQLKDEEKKLAGEFEESERLIFLIETFIKKKVMLLTYRINSKFSVVSFRLFNQLVNGGIDECCVFTVNGVPYDGGLNAAARTQGGLDIIRTLQEHYGIALPVFIDNRESVSEIPEMDCQVVNLIVSPMDNVIRVERA